MKHSKTSTPIKFILILFCAHAFGINAIYSQTPSKTDSLKIAGSLKYRGPKVSGLIVPAALIAIGASSFVIKPVRNFDYYIRQETNKIDPHFYTNAENYLQFGPIVMAYGLDIAGVEGKNNFADKTAILGLSAGILGITGYGTRYLTRNTRIHYNRFSNFPSMHTATVFMGAEFLQQEYADRSPIFTVIGYAFAGTVVTLRIYDRAHWLSEVVAGAGYGMLSAKAAYLIYPYLRNSLTHKTRSGRSTLIMPTYQDGVPGLVFIAVL